jgi:hypothetical protein
MFRLHRIIFCSAQQNDHGAGVPSGVFLKKEIAKWGVQAGGCSRAQNTGKYGPARGRGRVFNMSRCY